MPAAVPMPTPFGTLYTSNITPDPQTGIGTWTADEFYQMMHNGRFPTAACSIRRCRSPPTPR